MKQFYVKLDDGSVKKYNSISQDLLSKTLEDDLGFSGFSFVEADFHEDVDFAKHKQCLIEDAGIIKVDLDKLREAKLAEIRTERDKQLEANDKAWMIATKKAEDTTALEVAAQVLRDLPANAQANLNALETVAEIEAYDAFGE